MQICVSIVPAPGLAEAGESLSLDNLVREDARLLPQLKEVLETAQIFAKEWPSLGPIFRTTSSTTKPLRKSKRACRGASLKESWLTVPESSGLTALEPRGH